MNTSRTDKDASYLSEAFYFANECHATQKRKSTSIPYISHLMSVSALIMEYGGDEAQAVAGLLHDAIEDAPSRAEAERRRAYIKSQFVDRVGRIVDGCTDGIPDDAGDKGEWKQRKQAYLKHLAHSDPDTLLVSAADKLHNARAILADQRAIGDKVFTRFNATKEETLWYYGQLAELFRDKLPGPLANELLRTVEAINLASQS